MHVSITTVTIKLKKKLNICGGVSFESIWIFCLFKNILFTKIRNFHPKARRRASPPLSYGNPPPPHSPKKNLLHIQGFTLSKVIKQRLEQLEIIDLLSLEIFQRYSQFCKLTLPASPKLFARVTFISKGLCNNYQKEGGGAEKPDEGGGGIK